VRKGYAAPWTLGEQLQSGWFGSADGPTYAYWKRVCEISLDGTLLRDTHPLRRTPSLHEVRYSQKFGEAMIAARALARLDAGGIAIATGGERPNERPDLRAWIGGVEIGIEVGEVHPSAPATNAAIELSIALKELADSDPALRPHHAYLHIGRSPGRGGSDATPPKIRRRLITIVREILASGCYRGWLSDRIQLVQQWPGTALGYSLYVGPLPHAPAGYIKFDDSACSFDPRGLVSLALRMIARKRASAESYTGAIPLWLILGLTDERGVYTESLQWLAKQAVNIAPFNRVIAHDGMTFTTYDRGGVAA